MSWNLVPRQAFIEKFNKTLNTKGVYYLCRGVGDVGLEVLAARSVSR